MSAVASIQSADCLTYTKYLSEQTISERKRHIAPSPTWRHQRVQGRLLRAFQQYEE